MKKVLAGAICIAFLAALTAPAVAATEEGDQELTIAVQAQFVEDTTNVSLAVGFGYFVSDAVEIKGTALVLWSDDFTLGFFQLEGLFHFNTQGDAVPYIGAFGGMTIFDAEGFDDSLFIAGAMVGVKIFLTENTTLFIEVRYLHIFEDNAPTTILATVGISYFF